MLSGNWTTVGALSAGDGAFVPAGFGVQQYCLNLVLPEVEVSPGSQLPSACFGYETATALTSEGTGDVMSMCDFPGFGYCDYTRVSVTVLLSCAILAAVFGDIFSERIRVNAGSLAASTLFALAAIVFWITFQNSLPSSSFRGIETSEGFAVVVAGAVSGFLGSVICYWSSRMRMEGADLVG